MFMRVLAVAGMVIAAAWATTGRAAGDTAGSIDGRQAFEERCAECHANGGNSVNPAKTLQRKDREANGVKSARDIVARMRNPGPGMTRFDEESVSDQEAEAIAVYILTTFR